jgi:glycosyltransferase involved in cell wall biosynthesis
MRVAFVVPGDPGTTSGGFRYDRRLVAALRAAGDDVALRSVPWRRYPLGVADAPRTPLSRVARGVDVVVVDELAHPTFAARVGGSPPAPVVALVHHLRCDEGGPAAPLARGLERRFLARVDAAVCTSSATERSVRALAAGADGHAPPARDPPPAPFPTLVAPPTADQFDPAVTADDAAARATETPFRVVFVGALVPRKRPLALVDALAALDGRGDGAGEWSATFVGPQPSDRHAARVRRRCRRRGVADRVTLAGPVPTADLARVLRRGHVLALPSAHEGFGIAALEAMGFGLPPVVTDAGGATDLVTHDTDGLLVPPEGVGAVYAALDALASDRARLARLARGALARYRAHPPWSRTVQRVRAFLRAVAAGRAAVPPTAAPGAGAGSA